MPLNLHVAELVAREKVKRTLVGDSLQIISELQQRVRLSMLSHSGLRNPIATFMTEHGDKISKLVNQNNIGSKMKENVGAAFVAYSSVGMVLETNKIKMSYFCSVFQVECGEAIKALNWFLSRKNKSPIYLGLFTDSQPMCRGLGGLATSSSMLAEINQS